MRQIRKKAEPRCLTEWRAAHQNDPNFGYELINGNLREDIKRSLLGEQGEICAYTGLRIRDDSSHIEHPKPQTYCEPEQQVAYTNMLACFPAPNAPEVPYGARRKGSWPDPTQAHLFVSPLGNKCENRFSFNKRGEIKPSNKSDSAAAETIRALALDHKLLTDLRKEAIQATLKTREKGLASLDLSRARKRIATLDKAEREGGPLEPFCFALKQALHAHIRLVLAISESKRGRP
jgi:uncharacterized protein (TIGR02646 family)